MSNPPYWKIFCKWRRTREELNFATFPDHISSSELNRFAARYRLARAFNGIDADGYNKDTVNAYGALMRTFLAYSALEQFHKAVPPVSGRLHLSDRWADQANSQVTSLKGSDAIIQYLIQSVSHKKLRDKLIAFQRGEHENALIVATALRHAVAHGFMSVHPEGTSAKISQMFCNQMTNMLLSISDHAFIELLESLDIDFGPASASAT